MRIYAEYLFVENFVAGFFILLLTGKICGRHIKKVRLISGSVLCGLYSFMILIETNYTMSLLSKLLFSSFVTLYTFSVLQNKNAAKLKNLKTGLKVLITFYIVSFLMGGVTIALLYLGGSRGIAGNGALYIENATYLNVTIGIFISWLIGGLFAKYIRERTRVEKMCRNAVIEIDGKKWKLNAMVDTGNFLKEPGSGKPVAILCKSAAVEILDSGKVGKERFLNVPYRAVGSVENVLTGFIADKVLIDGKSEDMVFAVYEGEFNQTKDGNTYRLLLNRDIMEGGIAVNA